MAEVEALPDALAPKLRTYESKTADDTEKEIKSMTIKPTRNLLRL
jgi:hypothetical protein